MTTVLKVHLADLTSQFFHDLSQKFDTSTEIEIRVSEKKQKQSLFSEAEFWQIIGFFIFEIDSTMRFCVQLIQFFR